jgi:hypothetical protein
VGNVSVMERGPLPRRHRGHGLQPSVRGARL